MNENITNKQQGSNANQRTAIVTGAGVVVSGAAVAAATYAEGLWGNEAEGAVQEENGTPTTATPTVTAQADAQPEVEVAATVQDEADNLLAEASPTMDAEDEVSILGVEPGDYLPTEDISIVNIDYSDVGEPVICSDEQYIMEALENDMMGSPISEDFPIDISSDDADASMLLA